MTTIIVAILIFLRCIVYLVIFDIILSWLTLAGINFRPKFVSDILSPIYKCIRQYIPTSFGAFDFTPIIIVMSIYFIEGILLINFPQASNLLSQLIK